MRILVADDDVQQQNMLRKITARWGYDVETADNGIDALRMLTNETHPDIALLDWNMPGLQGVEVCRTIRDADSSKYIYLILLTGNTSREQIIEGLESGADDYITKPYEIGELYARLDVGRRTVQLHQNLHDKITELQEAISHIKTLQGLLPICCVCKKIRDDKGYWNQIEDYIKRNSGADFTHGLCPECMQTHYPEAYERRRRRLGGGFEKPQDPSNTD